MNVIYTDTAATAFNMSHVSEGLELTCRKTLVSCAQWWMHCLQLAASKANFLAAAASLPLATGGS